MAPLAERTPVAPVPEQLPVTTVGYDMIHYRGFRVPAVLPALLTQGVRLEKLSGCLPPRAIVSTAVSRPDSLRVHLLMILTELSSRRNKRRASGMSARSIGFGGHIFFSSPAPLNKDVGEVEKKVCITIF